MTTERIPWHAYPLLLWPRRIQRNLAAVEAAGVVPDTPNLWQLSLGVVRMWHRILFRPETIGTCARFPVRKTLRARLLHFRPLRFPFLVAERAIAPTDLTGLASSPERIIAHLLGAHHDGNQFVFDLQLLSAHPGKLEELHRRVRDILAHDTPRTRWLRDLTVYERYHENLEAAVAHALRAGVRVDADETDDPDITFNAYMAWCARQPATPSETLAALRAGRYDPQHGVQP